MKLIDMEKNISDMTWVTRHVTLDYLKVGPLTGGRGGGANVACRIQEMVMSHVP